MFTVHIINISYFLFYIHQMASSAPQRYFVKIEKVYNSFEYLLLVKYIEWNRLKNIKYTE